MALKNKKSAQGADKIPDNVTVVTEKNGSPVKIEGGVLCAFEPEVPSDNTAMGLTTAMVSPPLFDAEAVTGSPGEAGAGKDALVGTLAKMSLAGLLELRGDIDRLLPPISLQEINLEEELLLQYQLAKDLVSRTLASGEETNHKASALNACTRALQDIVKMQTDLYDAERMKMMETSLDRAFSNSGVSIEVRTRFFENYSAGLLELAAVSSRKDSPSRRVVTVR